MSDGNILENMQEFYQAMADSETIPRKCNNNDWVKAHFRCDELRTIAAQVEERRLRIEPEPLTTYYRVYESPKNVTRTRVSTTPLPDFEDWIGDNHSTGSHILLKDFEVTK